MVPCELEEAKVNEFRTLKQECMNMHEYNLKFTQHSHYALDMVANMGSMMSLFVSRLSRMSSKMGKATIFIGDMT